MISREDLVTQSVQTFARTQIFDVRDYAHDKVEFIEAFPYNLTKMDKNLIATGFNFDDDGTQAEMGSDLKRRVYTVEFWVFGLTNTYARNLANVLKFALDVDGTIPLLDVAQTPPVEIDRLLVDGVTAHRQIIPSPEPWQEFVWTTQVKVEDFYYASEA